VLGRGRTPALPRASSSDRCAFKVNGESLYVWGSNRVFYPNSMRLIDEAAVKADPRLKPPSEIKSVAKDPLL
jgi:hypothetical protein